MAWPARRIVITGGTGFVGRAVCERLVEGDSGRRIIVPSRRPSQGRALQVLPGVELRGCNVHEPRELASVLEAADAVVHLVAILHGRPADFERVHVELPRKLAAACRAAGVRRVIHVSALGVAPDAPSAYLRSKAAGEAVWRDSGLDVTVLRPSVIFGAEDRFTNLFAMLLRVFPALPLAGADARFQPVWVGDVASAIVTALQRPDLASAIVECAGPEQLTLREIVERVGQLTGHRRPVIGLPEGLGRLQATLMGLMPGDPLMSTDNLLSMRVPNVATGDHPGLAALGITPLGIDSLATHFRR
jgi:uncharacterized protein YbjT (DUF2867 family)